MRFNEITLNNLAAPEKGQAEYYDDTVPGFGYRISQGGTRRFFLLYRIDGRQKRVTFANLGLKDSRAAAKRSRIAVERTSHTIFETVGTARRWLRLLPMSGAIPL